MSCIEAQVIFTLALLKAERNVKVMTFTGDRNKLKPVNWHLSTTLEKALEDVQKEIVSFAIRRIWRTFLNQVTSTPQKETPKTKENISFPLKKAGEDKEKIDVFITFVSSIGRTCGANAKPPLGHLQEYRNAMRLKTSR